MHPISDPEEDEQVTEVQVWEGNGVKPPVLPRTVEEAVDYLLTVLPQEDQEEIRKVKAISLHHSLGQSIRNNFKLWDSFPDYNKALLNDVEKLFYGKKVMERDLDPDGYGSYSTEGVTHLPNGFIHPDVASNIIIEKLKEKL